MSADLLASLEDIEITPAMLVVDQFEQSIAAAAGDRAIASSLERAALRWLDGGNNRHLVLVIRDEYLTSL